MEKYEDVSLDSMSRTKRNQNVYNQTDLGELSRIKTNTNVSVISDAPKEIDIEKIKNYVYQMDNKGEEEKRKRLLLEIPEDEPIPEITRKEEKDYDINSVLERAKDKRNSDYEIDRHRKLSNTQIDILKNIKIRDDKIDVEKDPDITEPIDELNTEEKTIVDLIKDIQSHGNKKKDLFDDLMGGDDDTVVAPIELEASKNESLKEDLLSMTTDLESIKIPENDFTKEINIEKEMLKEVDAICEEKKLSKREKMSLLQNLDVTFNRDPEDEEEEVEEETTETGTVDLEEVEEIAEESIDNEEDDDTEETPKIKEVDKSFYSNSMTFNKSDFDGFEDLENGVKKSSALTKVAIFFIVLLLLGTIFLILNFVLDWNLL